MSEPLHIISLGAGVQSSTMALMAAAGEITPMPIAAIFADTQAEPASVYKWLDWLETKLPFPVYRVTKGNMTEVSLTIRKRTKTVGKPWSKSLIPAFVKTDVPAGFRDVVVSENDDGSTVTEKHWFEAHTKPSGIMGRSCTADFKIAPLLKKQREIAKIKRGQKTVGVVSWIGISLDEVSRMKPSRNFWAKNRWPLIEMEMSRHDCLRWMEKNGYPKPPRSACVYCPFHSDHEWRRLKIDEPSEFERAVQFEKDLQAVKRVSDNMNGVPFLHNSLIPLGQVDFSEDTAQGALHFHNECEGMCGV